MPLVLFLIGAATLALVASKKAHAGPSPMPLDRSIDPLTRERVEHALFYEQDPTRLGALAAEIEAYYPYSGWLLRSKAASLGRAPLAATAPVAPAPSRANNDGLDDTLPDNVRFNIVELLTMGTDPRVLEAVAIQLANYPRAAAALRARAAQLQAARLSMPTAPATGPTMPVGMAPPWTPGASPGAPYAYYPAPAPGPSYGPSEGPYGTPPYVAPVPPAPSPSAPPPRPPLPASSPREEPAPIPIPILSPTPPAPSVAPPASTQEAPSMPPASPPPAPVLPTAPAPPSPPSLLSSLGPLDEGMPQDEQAKVVSALATENDPSHLRALADALAARYPKAALLLSNKAEALQVLLLPGSLGTAMVPARPMGTRRTYRVEKGDFPIRIAKKFGLPERAWTELVRANPQKEKKADGDFKLLLPGEELVIPDPWPDIPSSPSPSGVTLSSHPAPPAPPAPIDMGVSTKPTFTPSLDPSLPGDIATAVLHALTTETKPEPLRGFASSLMGKYPIAAGLLLAKASALTAVPALATIAIPAPLPGSTYRVVQGDSPARIAKKITGQEHRWRELVTANPQKATLPNGHFKNLQPGDLLHLPPSWAVPQALASHGA